MRLPCLHARRSARCDCRAYTRGGVRDATVVLTRAAECPHECAPCRATEVFACCPACRMPLGVARAVCAHRDREGRHAQRGARSVGYACMCTCQPTHAWLRLATRRSHQDWSAEGSPALEGAPGAEPASHD
eukprot:1617662-Prymnesium_polylepis.1